MITSLVKKIKIKNNKMKKLILVSFPVKDSIYLMNI